MTDTFNGGTRANPRIELTDQRRTYITNHYATHSTYEMAQELKVSDYKVCKWMQEMQINKPRVFRCKQGEVVKEGFFTWDKNIATI